ncbi:MAG: ATP-binding protein [Sphingobacterium hotanense]
MNRICFLMLCFCLLHLFVWGQEIEHLDQNLKVATTEEQRFRALVELSDYWSYQDTFKAKDYLLQAKPLISGEDFLQGIYLFYEAGLYYGYNNPKSQAIYMQAEKYLKKVDTKESYRFRAKLWHNYGALEQQKDDDKAFLNITLTHCIPHAIKSGDTDLLMSYFTDVGMLFYNHKEYEMALEYYNKAINLVKSPDQETENLLWTYLNLFDLYFLQNQFEKSKEVLVKAETLLTKLSSKKLAAYFYKNKARILSKEKKFKEAQVAINEGLKLANQYNLCWDYHALRYERAQTYKDAGNLASAKQELGELLSDPRSTMSKSRLAMINEIAGMEAALGNYEQAYQWTRKYKELNDSIGVLDFKQQMAELETKYRTAEKEQEIHLLESRNLLNRTFIISGLVVAGLIGLWIWYAWNARKNRNISETLLLKQQREIDVAKALIYGEEQERKRLARELHDGLIGQVTGLKMNLERIARDHEPNDLSFVTEQLGSVIAELRQTAHNLEPTVLKNYGFEEAMRQFCQQMSSSAIEINFYSRGLEALKDKNIVLTLLRMIQELITNAVKHADATQIIVQAGLEDGFLLIEVEDDGKGFDTKQVKRNMGLNNLESRVKSLGGRLEIDSRIGEGTNFIITCQI